jgi:hypothetical protein
MSSILARRRFTRAVFVSDVSGHRCSAAGNSGECGGRRSSWICYGCARVPAAKAAVIKLAVVRVPEADGSRQGRVLLLCRWVVERNFAGLARFCRLARDDERLPQTVAGPLFLVFTCQLLHRLIQLPFSS